MAAGDEIIVEGSPFEPPIPGGGFGRRQIAPIPPEGLSFEPPLTPTTQPPEQTFAPPPVPPVIPEIIARGTPTTTRPPFGFGPAAKVNFATVFAVVGGLLVSSILRERSQAMLDAEFAELMRTRRRRPDSPVFTQQLVTPEIVVTGRRPVIPRVAPQPPPLITPDFDPFVLVPFVPRVDPRPAADPEVLVPTPELPELQPFRVSPQRSPINVPTRQPQISPATRPATRPAIRPATRPAIRPAELPSTQPMPLPTVSPTPSVRPSVFPRTQSDNLTSLKRRLAQSLRRRTQTSPGLGPGLAPQLQQQQTCQPCPKCKKEEEQEKPRDKCWKKLVREGLFPSLDESYEWERIDCITGRPI